jgi:serine protease Do
MTMRLLLPALLLVLVGFVLPARAQTQIATPPPPAPPALPAPPAAQDGPTLATLPSVAPVVQKVKPAVVNIFTVKVVKPRSLGRRLPRGFRGPSEEFDNFFGFPVPPPREYKERALGSGFIFDPSGLIITNNHVVEGADDIKVKLADGQEITAEVLGRDPKTDLALIKLTKSGEYPFINLGDSDAVEIGDWLVAIGNPFGLEHTVTAGILSARGRAIGVGPYDDFLQTDASINPGNSGGPLLNLKGDVVGINTIIISGGTGIGFAIPSKVAVKIIDQLKASGRVDRGWIGVLIQELTPDLAKSFGIEDAQGALVGDVIDGAPAKAAGIKSGDVIIEFDGRPIRLWQELTSVVADTPIGKTVDVLILRDNKRQTVKLTVAKLEDDGTYEQDDQSSPFNLGVTLRELTPELAARLGVEPEGLLVESVASGSLGEEIGLQAQDVILEVDRTPLKTTQDYQKAVRAHPKDVPMLLRVRRGSQTIYITLNQ